MIAPRREDRNVQNRRNTFINGIPLPQPLVVRIHELMILLHESIAIDLPSR